MKLSNWLILLAIISGLILIWSLKDILIQIFAGIVLAMAICSLVNRIRDIIKVPRPIALLICILSLAIIFSIILIIVIPPFFEELQLLINQLPEAATELVELTLSFINNISDLIYNDDQIRVWNDSIIINEFNPFPDGSSLAKGLGDGIIKILGLAGNLGTGVIRILFILAISIMISIQPSAYIEVAILLVPSSYRRRTRQVFDKCSKSINSWIIGVIISSLFVSFLAGIGLSLLGVKLVIANALLAGILNVIPNVGPVISTIFPMSVALLDSPLKALAVIGLYLFIQNVESYLITPSIMHQQVKLLPGLTLTAQFIFTIIFGPIGLLLSLPLAVIIQVLVKEMIIYDLFNQWDKRYNNL